MDSPPPHHPHPAAEAHVSAEKDLLLDFGVSASPLHPRQPHNNHHRLNSLDVEDPSVPWINETELPVPPPIQTQETPSQTADPGSFSAQNSKLPPLASVSHQVAPPHPPQVSQVVQASSTAAPTYDSNTKSPPALATSQSNEASNSVQTPVSMDRAKQLVSQFATLASRLGIDLPSNVLQSLTASAAMNGSSIPSAPEADVRSSTSSNTSDTKPQAAVSGEGSSSKNKKQKTIDELRKAAEEAVAAVTKKRPLEITASALPATNGATASNKEVNNTANKPLYSKRRKKPRLQDCESKLEQLKAENEVLKRHLQNVTNKAQMLDKEKNEASNKIKQLFEQNAGPEEMDKVIQEFTEMYSDYGRRRQQELSFHLEQLQRYVKL